MCGIAGYADLKRRSTPEELASTVMRMANTLRHRGPDDEGCWVDPEVGLALGHRRLSIIDLSPTGHQPMVSPSGRYVVIFNGEIYNFRELRRELERELGPAAPAYKGHSDTAVMLAAFEHWGVADALPRLNGMFAIALWDRVERLLYLVRDRLGEKPLYYGWMGETFLFGSELKALQAHPEFRGEIDRNAIALYLYSNSIPAPGSIFRDIRKLPPATFLKLRLEETRAAAPVPYWSVKSAVEKAQADPFRGGDEDALDELQHLLRDAVRLRMIADVPFGAFLSGGIDSSLVVSMMKELSGPAVRSFSIGFHEAGYNEARDAHSMARYLSTEHVEHYATVAEAVATIPSLASLYDEPFADSSQIPTLLVSRLASRYVKVALSGDGGDEVFGGYNRYTWVGRIWRKVGWVPQPLRRAAGSLITRVPPHAWDAILRSTRYLLPEAARQPVFGDKLHKLAEVMGLGTPEEMYIGLAVHWREARSMVLGTEAEGDLFPAPAERPQLQDFEHKAMFLDMMTWLTNDILTKLDRASMACSLETRIPLLDPRIIEFAWRLPLSMKFRQGKGKWILRRLLQRYVPESMVKLPKMGFGIPLDVWLRGPLREWAESLLEERRLRREGYLDPAPIRRKWQEHLSGRRNWHFQLWDVLMWEAWLEENRRAKVTGGVPLRTAEAIR